MGVLITLTDAEKTAACEAMGLYLMLVNPETALQAAIDAINDMRRPDPIGTVRADGEKVAMKTGFKVDAPWHIAGPNMEPTWGLTEFVADWPVVYRPKTS